MFTLESQQPNAVIFRSEDHRLRLAFSRQNIARITFTSNKLFLDRESRIVVSKAEDVHYDLQESEDVYELRTEAITIRLNKTTGSLRYFDTEGKLLMQEPERGGKWLTSRQVTRNVFDRDTTVELGQSIDGARATATKYKTVFAREAFEAKLEFLFTDDEALFGLGSHEEGYANLRGRSRELYQQNMKAVVPHLVSTRGYSVLLDCCSLMTFHDDALGSYWWADCVDELDFYFIQGKSHDEVIRGYRELTGPVPLPPKWAFGYVQSKERYVTAAETVAVVAEYRRRKVPLDVIVLDWKSWPNGAGWGQKTFDPLRFPDPQGFTKQLHAMGARLMVSIWPIMTGGCEDQRELLEQDLMLGNKSTYNAFLPDGRELYWQQAERGLFANGIDAWWCDCTEPFEADWSGAVKPELHTRLAINTGESKLYLDPADINAYSLLHSQGIYEGQRRATDMKRVLNLTRSSYAGQSRYGAVTWNGDISATWEWLRRSIAEGLNFCATGEPYWTVDVGGFFIANNPKLWFWRGDYNAGTRGLTDMNALEPDAADTGCTDLGFHELYTRWIQYAVFLPMFRSHGTDAAREIWRFGEEGSLFYDTIADSIRLRYRLLPYIYSVAADVTFQSSSTLRALALQFPNDPNTHNIADQFMFGPALMVCPVTQPVLYGRESKPLGPVSQTRSVYLPASQGWYDFWTNALLEGGQIIEAEAPLERIPVYVRAGSIVPLAPVMQYVDEIPDAPYEIHVYTGVDAAFTLYEDDGNSYAYEQGAYARTHLHWSDKTSELAVSEREGSFEGLVREREMHIVFHTPTVESKEWFRYNGSEQHIAMNIVIKKEQR